MSIINLPPQRRERKQGRSCGYTVSCPHVEAKILYGRETRPCHMSNDYNVLSCVHSTTVRLLIIMRAPVRAMIIFIAGGFEAFGAIDVCVTIGSDVPVAAQSHIITN